MRIPMRLSTFLLAAAIAAAGLPAWAVQNDSHSVGMVMKPAYLRAKEKALLTPARPVSRQQAIKKGWTAKPLALAKKQHNDDDLPLAGGIGTVGEFPAASENSTAPTQQENTGGLGGITFWED